MPGRSLGDRSFGQVSPTQFKLCRLARHYGAGVDKFEVRWPSKRMFVFAEKRGSSPPSISSCSRNVLPFTFEPLSETRSNRTKAGAPRADLGVLARQVRVGEHDRERRGVATMVTVRSPSTRLAGWQQEAAGTDAAGCLAHCAPIWKGAGSTVG